MKHDKSFDKYEPEQLKDLSRRAGICSGKARRKKRMRIDREKVRQRARSELIREEINGIRIEAKRLKAVSRFERQ